MLPSSSYILLLLYTSQPFASTCFSRSYFSLSIFCILSWYSLQMARSWSKRNSRIKYHTTTKSCVLLLCDFTIRKASQVFGLSTPLPCNLLSFFQPGFLLLLNLLFSMVAQQNSKFLLAFRRHKLAFLPNLGQYPVFHILLSKIVGLPMD